jgi:uncharacterized protein YdaU (DUF1376 family)
VSLPYFPLYPSDFEAKTSHLTLEEDGAYNRLLRLSWMTPGCSLPDDPAWIARRMRVDTATYERVVAPLLNEFFYRAKGRVLNPKLTEIHGETNEKHARRVEAGKLGGRPPNPLKSHETGQSNAKAMPKQPEPEPEPVRERGKPLSSTPDGFDEFWAVVPRKTDKEDARKAYAKALRKTDAKTLIAGMARYAEERRGQDPQYTKHPATWLNKGSWGNETQPMTLIPGGNIGKPSRSEDRLNAFVAGARRSP